MNRGSKARDMDDLDRRARQKIKRRLKRGNMDTRQPPDFIIIGAQKGGTTSLYRYLTEQPAVGGATKKEVHYFDRNFDKGLGWYLAHFPKRDEFEVVGESGPSYLFHPDVPGRVRELLPEAKLIVLLRNPVDRAYSQYQMRTRRQGEADTFEGAIAEELEHLRLAGDVARPQSGVHFQLARGIYVDQLKRWLRLFPRQQMLVLQSEPFFARPEAGLDRALAFLDLPAWRPAQFEIHNPGGFYGEMQPETRQRLAAYYAPHNRRLYDLLGTDFEWDEA